MLSNLNNFDHAIFEFLRPQGNDLDELMRLISSEEIWLAILFFVVCWAAYRKSFQTLKKLGLALVIMGLTDAVCFNLLKPTFERYRPCYQMQELDLRQKKCGGYYGFPSNHASNGAAFATSLLLLFPGVKALRLVMAVPLAVGYSRIYIGVHYPGDVVAGFLFGALFSWLLVVVWRFGQMKFKVHR